MLSYVIKAEQSIVRFSALHVYITSGWILPGYKPVCKHVRNKDKGKDVKTKAPKGV